MGGRIFLIRTVNSELVTLLHPGRTNRNVQMNIYLVYSQYPANGGELKKMLSADFSSESGSNSSVLFVNICTFV